MTVSDERLIVSSRIMILALFVALVILAGCRQRNSISNPSETVQISLNVEPSPPSIGEAVLIVTLQDERSDPIQGALVQVRGDMSHAGMAPEFGEVETVGEGKYRIPFEWTMGGDWILTITATLSTGEIIEDTFEFTVE
jgi:hypothetical protein